MVLNVFCYIIKNIVGWKPIEIALNLCLMKCSWYPVHKYTRNGEIRSFLIPFLDLGIAILGFRVLLSPRQVPALFYFQNQF